MKKSLFISMYFFPYNSSYIYVARRSLLPFLCFFHYTSSYIYVTYVMPLVTAEGACRLPMAVAVILDTVHLLKRRKPPICDVRGELLYKEKSKEYLKAVASNTFIHVETVDLLLFIQYHGCLSFMWRA